MENNSEAKIIKNKNHPKTLFVLTTIYTVLYIAMIVSFLFFEDSGIGELNYEGVLIILSILLYLTGYYYVWRNYLVTGIIFIAWWLVMWYIGLFVAETDRGAGVVMGVPVFLFGIFFILTWIKRKKS